MDKLRLHQDATTKVSCNTETLHERTGLIHMQLRNALQFVGIGGSEDARIKNEPDVVTGG
jgi:hypothetical protein